MESWKYVMRSKLDAFAPFFLFISVGVYFSYLMDYDYIYYLGTYFKNIFNISDIKSYTVSF